VVSRLLQPQEIVAELMELLAIPSPTGRADRAADYCAERLQELGLEVRRTVRGAVLARVQGRSDSAPRVLTAHIDTLGAMVQEIMPDGRLRLSPVGGLLAPSCEGAYVTVLTRGAPITGTILPECASKHVFGPKYEEQKRTWAEMRLRLDLPVFCPDDVLASGVRVGDFVAVDPRAEHTPAGFVKSRFLDDKAAAAALLAAAREIVQGEQPQRTTYLHFSVYEEIGQGVPAGLPPEVEEVVSIDMAAVGAGQNSREDLVTICAKDSGGPYDWSVRQRLGALADLTGIAWTEDIYPYYSSDATGAVRCGRDVRIGLFGPGVDASHTHERTHAQALLGTAQLALAYLREDG